MLKGMKLQERRRSNRIFKTQMWSNLEQLIKLIQWPSNLYRLSMPFTTWTPWQTPWLRYALTIMLIKEWCREWTISVEMISTSWKRFSFLAVTQQKCQGEALWKLSKLRVNKNMTRNWSMIMISISRVFPSNCRSSLFFNSTKPSSKPST